MLKLQKSPKIGINASFTVSNIQICPSVLLQKADISVFFFNRANSSSQTTLEFLPQLVRARPCRLLYYSQVIKITQNKTLYLNCLVSNCLQCHPPQSDSERMTAYSFCLQTPNTTQPDTLQHKQPGVKVL